MHAVLTFLLARLLWTVPLTIVCLGALVRGGWERFVGCAFALADITTVLVLKPKWQHFSAPYLLVEVAFLTAICLAAVRSDRWWPMPATSAKLFGVMMLLAAAVSPKIWLKAYYFGSLICDCLVLICLAFGVFVESRRRELVIA